MVIIISACRFFLFISLAAECSCIVVGVNEGDRGFCQDWMFTQSIHGPESFIRTIDVPIFFIYYIHLSKSIRNSQRTIYFMKLREAHRAYKQSWITNIMAYVMPWCQPLFWRTIFLSGNQNMGLYRLIAQLFSSPHWTSDSSPSDIWEVLDMRNKPKSFCGLLMVVWGG